MTKAELQDAQFFFNVWERAHDIAERRDPKRDGEESVAFCADKIRANAAAAFLLLTGRPIYRVDSVHELNTETPAVWTLNTTPNPNEGRGRR